MPSKPMSGRYSAEGCGLWTEEEHKRFLSALEIYPNGPWKKVSELVRTRNSRQTMTHAQKYRQKLARHERGLRPRKKTDSEDKEAASSVSKSLSRVVPRQETGSDKNSTTANARSFPKKEETQAQHFHELLSYQHPSWPTTASPVDVSVGESFQFKLVPPQVHPGSSGAYFSDKIYAGHWQRSHNLTYPEPLDPQLAFGTPTPPSTDASLPLDPLPLVASVDDPRWIDECYDLFVGAVV